MVPALYRRCRLRKVPVNPKTAVAGRYEYLNDHDGLALGFNGGLAPYQHPLHRARECHDHPQEFTATLEHTFAGHLISRLEYRHDFSNQDIYESAAAKAIRSLIRRITRTR